MKNKITLISGAGRGIGKGITRVLAEAGAHVVATSLTDKYLPDVSKELQLAGHPILTMRADATSRDDMRRVVESTLENVGHLDGLVNCVGDAISKPVVKPPNGVADGEGLSDDEWRFIIDVNLTEAFQGCRAFGSDFIAQGEGSVINISGIMGLRGQSHLSAYSAAKGGLTQFTQAMAKEWAPYGVRINAIAPGSFPDPQQMTSEIYEARQKEATRVVPLGRLGNWRDLGLLTVFLSSEASSYVTGQCWAVDGGVSIVGP